MDIPVVKTASTWTTDVGTLRPDEIELIAVIFSRPPMCPARGYALQLLAGLTPEHELDIQIFLRQHGGPCSEIWALERLYDDYCIRRREKDRRQRDPTIQERDRKNSHHRQRGFK